MARVHVLGWQQAYRGQMPDEFLDDPEFIPRRERFWTATLTDPRYAQNKAAVAERDGGIIGIAMSGPAQDEDAAWSRQLYVLYVPSSEYGSGAGAELLDAVIDPEASAGLWVADPNPRAQAFYRKHRFEADGTSKFDDGVNEIRMVRR